MSEYSRAVFGRIRRLLIVVVVGCAIYFGLTAYRPYSAPGYDGQARFDYVARAPQRFVVSPGPDAWTYGPFRTENFPIRARIETTVPVNLGVKTSPDAPDWYCSVQNTMAVDLNCNPPPGEYSIVVHDTRDVSAGAGLVAGVLAGFGAKGPMQQMTARNELTVTLYDWKCVEHCR